MKEKAEKLIHSLVQLSSFSFAKCYACFSCSNCQKCSNCIHLTLDNADKDLQNLLNKIFSFFIKTKN